MKKIIILTFALVCIATTNYSQDLKAGEIFITNISGFPNDVGAYIYLYQNIATYVPRPTIVINWGGGSYDTLPIISSSCGDSNTITNRYEGFHIYPGPGNYTITCIDSFRMANVQNIANSANEKMFLQYHLSIPPVSIGNSSPISGNCAHDFWHCCNYIYNPGFFDLDSDSLSYQLVPASPNYTFPPASLDSITGDLTFNPTATGLYSFCMKVDEWRIIPGVGTIRIGSNYRQMQIDVYSLTAVNENSNTDNFSLYPNPFNTHTVLSFTDKETAMLNLYNSQSQLVRMIDNIAGGMVTIERNELTDGLYFFVLYSDKRIIAKGKLVVE